jgi:hypothetical protein
MLVELRAERQLFPSRPRVNDGRREAPNLVEETALGVMGNVVSFADGQVAIDHNLDLGPQGVADPAQPHLIDAFDTRGGWDDAFDLIDKSVSTASRRRAKTCLAAERSTDAMATVMTRPIMGSGDASPGQRRRHPGARPGW